MVTLDEKGHQIQSTVMVTDGNHLRQQIASIKGHKEVVLEEGTMSAWLAQKLRPVADRLVVCDPTENAKFFRDRKSDEPDARRLADLLRLGALKAVYHPDHPIDDLRSPLRSYVELTQETTRVKNRIQAVYRSRGIATRGEAYAIEYRACFSQWI